MWLFDGSVRKIELVITENRKKQNFRCPEVLKVLSFGLRAHQDFCSGGLPLSNEHGLV